MLRSAHGTRLEARAATAGPLKAAYLYVLSCAEGSYYVGTTVAGLERRMAEHHAGAFDGHTAARRPVELAFYEHFARLKDAASAERQIKRWRREKKEALIRGDVGTLPSLARRGATAVRPSRTGPAGRSSRAARSLVKGVSARARELRLTRPPQKKSQSTGTLEDERQTGHHAL